MQRRAPAVRFFLAATVVFALTAMAAQVDPLSAGLRATYFGTEDWSGAPAYSTIEGAPSTDTLLLAWRDRPPDSFSAIWTGSLFIVRDGAYTFATASDDGSTVAVDGQSVVDNGGVHARRFAAGTIHLTRGVHRLVIAYFQAGRRFNLDVSWARDGVAFTPLPDWALAPRAVSGERFGVSVAIRLALRGALWLWLIAVAVLIVVAAARAIRDAVVAGNRAAAVEWVLIYVGGAMLVFVLPHHISTDGAVRYAALVRVLERHELSGVFYSMVGPLCSAPLYLAGALIGPSPRWWCERFNALVFVGGIAAMWQVLRPRVDARTFRAFALLLMTASMCINHLQNYFGEVFTATLVAAGLLAVACGRAAAGWTIAVLGVANTPATFVGLAAAAAVHAWQTRRLRHVLAIVAAGAFIALESWIRRGSLIDTGYVATAGNPTVLTYSGRPGFSYPLFFGVLSVLFSFGKGLAFYAPGLLLPVRSRLAAIDARLRSTFWLWIAFLCGIILVYAKWWAWFGGWTWGPRFFLFAAFPASFALAVALDRRAGASSAFRVAVLMVLTLSTWVAIDGALFGLAALDLCLNDTFASLCWYVPEFSPLWRPFVQYTAPPLPSLVVGAYFVVVYAWFAVPVARGLWRPGVAAASAAYRAATAGEPWRI